MVDLIRAELQEYISLVALYDMQIAGHILFSPVTISENPERLKWAGLARMAVAPDYQRRGIGIKLIEEELKVARDEEYHGVVVLGYPEYYSRFGFDPAHIFGLKSTYYVPDEAFM